MRKKLTGSLLDDNLRDWFEEETHRILSEFVIKQKGLRKKLTGSLLDDINLFMECSTNSQDSF